MTRMKYIKLASFGKMNNSLWGCNTQTWIGGGEEGKECCSYSSNKKAPFLVNEPAFSV